MGLSEVVDTLERVEQLLADGQLLRGQAPELASGLPFYPSNSAGV